MTLKDVEVILQKYNGKEITIVKNLETCEQRKQSERENYAKATNKDLLSFQEAVQRNKDLLAELDVVKGNLRSKAIFSPTELHWDAICLKYRNCPSLPVSTWRCHLPVFV